MNKIHNINLGGYPFAIDADAYTYLSNYLNHISDHFRHSEGYDEIMGDIENRCAELLKERLGQKEIVSKKDVSLVIDIMGRPEDFGAEPIDSQRRFNHEHSYRMGKKLFRDPTDKVIGGVCSGIAAYFGIQDPLWVRLGFVVFTLSGGFGVVAYLLLWALMPEAKSPKDFLAMKGDPINIQSIADFVEDQIDNLSSQIDDLGKSFSKGNCKKSNRKKRNGKHSEKFENQSV